MRRGKIAGKFLCIAMALSLACSSLTISASAEEFSGNLAQGKTVTANPDMNADANALKLVTNGGIARGWDKSFGYHTGAEAENTSIKPWIQIDLEQSYDLSQIKYYGILAPDAGYDNVSHNMVFRVSNDPDFADESTTTVYNSDKSNFFGFGNGANENVTNTEEGYVIDFAPTNARYIRYYQHGAKQPPSNIWINALTACEIEAYAGSAQPPPLVPAGNLAYKARVSGSAFNSAGETISDWWGGYGNNDLQEITCGKITDNWKAPRVNPGGSTGDNVYLLLDMADVKTLTTVKLWNKNGMTYLNQIVQLSEDGTNWENVYNSDKDNKAGQDPSDSGKTVCGGKLTNATITGVKAGNDTAYEETADGQTIDFPATQARYIRWWCSGKSDNDLPQMIQLQAFHKLTVTFDYNDGSGRTENMWLMSGGLLSKPTDPVSSKLGFLFDKWTVDAAGGEEWDFLQPVTGDLKLLANWKKAAIHTVSFDTDGGSPMNPVQVTEGTPLPRPSSPEKEGYVFAGWRLDGEPYGFTDPVLGNITLTAAWALPAEADALSIQAGLLNIVMDSHGNVTNLVSTLDGTDYYTSQPDGESRSLISLAVNYKMEFPTSLTYDEDAGTLTFGFASINTEATVALEECGDYVTLTLTDLQQPSGVDVQAILWGPLKTSITTGGQTVGAAYNDTYAIGMHMLNTKTVGGWPMELGEDDYVPNLPNVNGFPDSRVCRDTYLNTAAFSTWGSALRGYTWDYTQDTNRIMPWTKDVWQMNPAMTGYHADENASMIGSSIALYGTRKDNILNVISNIQVNEGLPHPTIDGEWQKTSIQTGQDFLVYNDAIWGLDVVENDAKMANAAGINYIYGQYGASGPWNGEGSYSFNGNFGGSDDAVAQMVEKAGEYGVYVGTHTLSNLISGGTQYTSPEAASALSYSGFAALTRDVGVGDSEIYVNDGYPFSDRVVAASGGSRLIRIGGELLSFDTCTQVGPKEWKLSITQRGVWTTAAEHQVSQTAYKLWAYYTTPLLGGWDSIEPMTSRMGDIYSDLGVHCMSYDSFESTKFSVYSPLLPTEFMKGVYNRVNDAGMADGFITEASDMTTNVWDVHSRISWGESDTPVNAMMNYMGYYRQNFFPAMLGWMYDHGGHGGYGKGTLLMNLSMKGGWNAGAGWYVNRNTFNQYPYMADMLKTWNNAIQRGAFVVGEAYSAELQSAMKNAWTNGRVWSLTETTANQEWVLQEVSKSNTEQKIGEPVTLYASKAISTRQSANGDIATNVSLEYSRAHAGDRVTVYVQPHTGYQMTADSLKVVGTSGKACALTPVQGQKGVYSFVLPGEDVVITAEFRVAQNPAEVDKTALEKLYNANKDKTKGDYTNGSWKAFQDALKAAAKVLKDEKAEQPAVDAALKALQVAIDGLVLNTPEPPTDPDEPEIPGSVDEAKDAIESLPNPQPGKEFTETQKAQIGAVVKGITALPLEEQKQLSKKEIDKLDQLVRQLGVAASLEDATGMLSISGLALSAGTTSDSVTVKLTVNKGTSDIENALYVLEMSYSAGELSQPQFPIRIEMKLPKELRGKEFKLVHVKGDGTRAEVDITRSGNTLEFWAESFSSYVFAETNPKPEPPASAGSPGKIIDVLITVEAGPGGKVSPQDFAAADFGDTVTLTVTPDKGYRVDKAYVDGVEVQLTEGQYSFIDVIDGHTFKATFTQAAPAVPEEPKEAEKPQASQNPKTGDRNGIVPTLALLGFSGVALLLRRKKAVK